MLLSTKWLLIEAEDSCVSISLFSMLELFFGASGYSGISGELLFLVTLNVVFA